MDSTRPISRMQLKECLSLIKDIIQEANIVLRPCFISYAWESGDENKRLQKWLADLKEDLEFVEIKTFLDIHHMHGNMRACMEENIKQGGFVLLIGTSKFKERVEQDRLYKMPRMIFDMRMGLNSEKNVQLSREIFKEKAIVLIEGEDIVYFIEDGKILHKETTMARDLKLDEGINWRKIDTNNTYCADISKKVNDIIDNAKNQVGLITEKKSKTFGSSITNVAFEFGFTLEKGKESSAALIPLLYKGDFESSFPRNIFKENLIRDVRKEEYYGDVLVGLSSPLGIIPAICPQLIRNQSYIDLINKLQSTAKTPKVSPTKRINDKGEALIKLTVDPTDFAKQEKIGKGSFGVVHKGEWANITVAIKELRAGKMPDRILSKFKNEAFIMAQCRHPNIVQLYGICLEQPYVMIMEFLVNGSLFHYLHGDKKLEWSQKYKIATDVAVGLEFLHKNNIIHRDIKSSNVLLSQELNAKISDYGLAKTKTYSDNTTTVSFKNNVGTTLWKAPELLKRGGVCSNASDVYSYGMLLWEIASHTIPFADAPSIDVACIWIKEGQKEAIPEDCPTSFAEIINICWHELPEVRPKINEVLQRLINLIQKIKEEGLPGVDEKYKTKSAEQSSSLGYVSKRKTQDSIDNSELRPVESVELVLCDEVDAVSQKISTLAIDEVSISSSSSATIFYQYKEKLSNLEKFFKHVGYGEQDEAEEILKKDQQLVVMFGDLKDCSLRTWKNITAFQYSLLALDYHMWMMIKKYLDMEQMILQVEGLINKATLQIKDNNGWVINSDNNIDWPPIGLLPLIEALDTYVKNYDYWDYERCRAHWCRQVGKAQLTLPAHIINEYSNPSRSFYPCPTWDDVCEPILSRTGVYDWRASGEGNNLGVNFAWIRSEGPIGRAAIGGGKGSVYIDAVKNDLTACTELLKSRTKQAENLILEITARTRSVLQLAV